MSRQMFIRLVRWTIDSVGVKRLKNKNQTTDYYFSKKDMYDLRMTSNLIVNPSRKKAEAKIRICFFCEEKLVKENKNDCHLVPKSFLNKIAVDQKVCVFDTIPGLNRKDPENYFNSKIDADSAGTFFGACSNCDGPKFAVYEDPQIYDLTCEKMNLIAIKTLLAFRYFNLCASFRSLTCIELVNKESRKQFSLNYSDEEISDFLMHQKPVNDHLKLYLKGLEIADITYRCADAVQNNLIAFQKILDFEIPGSPVVALQSFVVIDSITVHVNIFPINNGSRILVFLNQSSDSCIDDKRLRNYSLIELIALATANFRASIFLSPKVSLEVKEGDSLFALLGPNSNASLSKKDLRIISRNLAAELNLDDPRMLMKIDKLNTD